MSPMRFLPAVSSVCVVQAPKATNPGLLPNVAHEATTKRKTMAMLTRKFFMNTTLSSSVLEITTWACDRLFHENYVGDWRGWVHRLALRRDAPRQVPGR